MKIKPLTIAIIGALQSCASLPPEASQPNMRANAAMPNCIAFCEISVTTEFAQEDIQSSGGGSVVGGAQSEAATTTQSESASPTVDVGSPVPKPKKDGEQ